MPAAALMVLTGLISDVGGLLRVVHLWRDKWTALSGPLSLAGKPVSAAARVRDCPAKQAQAGTPAPPSRPEHHKQAIYFGSLTTLHPQVLITFS